MNIPALEAAFRATTYRVDVPGGCVDLRIAQPSPAFDAFLRRQCVSSWGLVTACNPQAVCLSDDENQRLQAQLITQLEAFGWRFFPACSFADAGNWPAEPGCLILEVSEVQLRALAAGFSQRAFVYGETGSAPCLLWV